LYKPPASGENLQTAYTNVEGQVGRKFDIIYRYHDMSNAGVTGQFPDANEKALSASGHIILANWASRVFSSNTNLQWSAIAAGTYDASVIDPEAARIKAFGKPIMLSLDAEMDARVGTNGTAANYVAAYRHIHDRFAADGVTNVIWVWTITGSGGHDSMFASLYPGNAYVDWVGFDPYNFYNCQAASGTWRTFATTVSQPYQWLEANGFGVKPFILPEYGTVPDPANASAAATWYSQLPAALASYPNIKGMLEWDDQTGACNAALTASTGEMAAFATAGKATVVQAHLN
jgi:hypothetical protein